MVIEWLKFQVDPERREQFIQVDDEIWTTQLSSYPGFAGKEVWIDPTNAASVVFVIRWATRSNWKDIPVAELDATEKRFSARMGQGTYRLIETGEFQIRKFPQP
jgi:uncharacterized protein (TIGR03792 family)